MQDLMPQITINITAAKEHVSEVKRRIRVIKERARGILTTLPYKMMPHKMVIHLMYFVMLWLNAFPIKTGISDKFSPRKIIAQQKLNSKAHCQVPFGSYCEIHDEPNKTNSMAPRSRLAIALGLMRNIKGTCKFFCLLTGKVLKHRRWTHLPMPANN